jgi:GT2 family glycosyltransferase
LAEQQARIAVILVNWRNAPDTIECLETLLRSSIPVHAIVCDNASGDGSTEAIAAWAAGREGVALKNAGLSHLTDRPLKRPIAFDHLKPGDSLAEGPSKPLTIVETGGNLGYAGGNNAGLRLAARNPSITHFWLLNNDTVVEHDTAAHILACFDARPELGMVGAELRLYHEPSRLQMQGMLSFDKWTGRALGIGAGRLVTDPLPTAEVERAADFVCGASLTVSRPFLEQVGLLEDRYFLYYEEIDWAVRGRDRFKLGYCPNAVVYHKEGASAGSSLEETGRSPLSEYHHTRSRLIFSRLHYPAFLPLYFGYGLALAARRLANGQRAKAATIVRASLGLPFVRR